jgi:hypothetical protein
VFLDNRRPLQFRHLTAQPRSVNRIVEEGEKRRTYIEIPLNLTNRRSDNIITPVTIAREKRLKTIEQNDGVSRSDLRIGQDRDRHPQIHSHRERSMEEIELLHVLLISIPRMIE